MNELNHPPPPESIAGLIERVTFHSPETGFAVLRVQVKGRRELATVVGTLASVSAGEWLTAQGTWVLDTAHGLQFKAELLRSSPPTSREGIEKYLGSGLIKGIGPVSAQRMVAKFGPAILEIIDQASARLEEIDGIGPERRRRIKAAWAEQKMVRDIMVFLHSHGVSTSRAVRIYKHYGETAIETVRANPYALATDIAGIGFRSADQIAQHLGIPANSMLRVCAGLTHLLLEATQAGHCALPRDLLLEQTIPLLAVPEPAAAPLPPAPSTVDAALVTVALDQMRLRREVVEERIGDTVLIFHPAMQQAESGIAASLRQLGGLPSAYPPIDLPRALAWCQKQTGKTLAPSQQSALAIALAHRVVIVTGGPGVGKTTLLDSLLRLLRAKKIRCLLCAPTGRAAQRLAETTGLEAKTIHRLLEYQPQGGFGRNADHPLEGDLVVVDEMSMVDVPLMYRLLRALPPKAGLLLVGDVDQLPSVGPGMVLRDLIESGVAPVVRLTEVFRQAAGSRIITTAHRINQGLLPEPAPKDEAADFYFIERDDPAALSQTLVELIRQRIPKKFGLDSLADIQVLSPMNRGSLGTRELNRRLQAELNPPRPEEPAVDRFGWQFRPRDKVIQTENDYEKEVFNGDIGRVQRIAPVEQTLTVVFDGRPVTYDFGELDEIALAYAITIHKSQGSEFPAVVIPLATQHYLLLQRNLIYTGITRGKQLVMVIGQRRALNLAVRNARSEQRYSGLLARLRGEADVA